MPAVPPYSSTTTASCSPDSRSRVSSGVAAERLRHGRHGLGQLRSGTSAQRAAGTPNACLTWTTPTSASGSPSSTGKRENPVFCDCATSLATVSSASRDATRTRGVMRSSATRSVKRSERSSSVAVPSSRVPRSALARTSELSSPGERAERSSSAGSTPSLRTMALAMALSALISQRNA